MRECSKAILFFHFYIMDTIQAAMASVSIIPKHAGEIYVSPKGVQNESRMSPE